MSMIVGPAYGVAAAVDSINVAAKIKAFTHEPRRAGPVGVGVCLGGLLAEQVGVVLQSRLNLRAVEPHGPVNAVVADENHVVLIRIPIHLVKGHVCGARAALEEKDRLSRMIRASQDAGHRQRDQLRRGVGPFLGHDERATFGGIVAVLSRVLARLEDQIGGLRALRHRDRAGVWREAKVRETGDQQRDQRERDHA
jgi:hypothetical protein